MSSPSLALTPSGALVLHESPCEQVGAIVPRLGVDPRLEPVFDPERPEAALDAEYRAVRVVTIDDIAAADLHHAGARVERTELHLILGALRRGLLRAE